MKNLLFAVVLLLLLTGCGSGRESGRGDRPRIPEPVAEPSQARDVSESQTDSAEYQPPYFREPNIPDPVPAPDLGIDQAAIKAEMLSVATECRAVLENCREAVDTSDGTYFLLTDQEKAALLQAVGRLGYAAADPRMDMLCADRVRAFYSAYAAGEETSVSVYTFAGTLHQTTFFSRAGKVYGATSSIRWDAELRPAVDETLFFSELEVFELTPKGFLFYGSDQESTLHVRTVAALRVEPLGDENRRILRAYIDPLISYASTGVFSRDWDISTVERVGFNDAYEFLYRLEYGGSCAELYTESFYADTVWPLAVPAAEFEPLLMKYFPVSAEELRALSVYDPARQVYALEPMIHPDASPDWEVVGFSRDSEGLLTVTMDAVSPENRMDRTATNTVVIQESADGGFRYLSNRLIRLDKGVSSRVPAFAEYRPRVSERAGAVE